MDPQKIDPVILQVVNDKLGKRCQDIIAILLAAKIPLDDLTWTAMSLHATNRLTIHIISMEEMEQARATLVDSAVKDTVESSKAVDDKTPRIISPPPGFRM